MESKTKGITASDLKYIAILAMFIDHVAWLFVPTTSVSGQIMHFIGRTTAPVMCFFISEGFHYTRNIRKYLGRMCIFAVISHFAFVFYKTGSFFEKCNESMITTLTLCLLAVCVVNSEKINKAFKLPIILIIAQLAEKCDWGMWAVLFTLAFELARGNRKNQLISYSIVAFTYVLPNITSGIGNPDILLQNLYRFGVFLPIPLLMLYNGEKGGSKNTKWVFYIFYPAHLILLQLINIKYG